MVTSRKIPTGTKGELSEKALLLKEIQRLKDEAIKVSESARNNSEGVRPDRVTADDYVEVISLCPMHLTLTTEPKGRGFSYTWNKFGESTLIVYSDLQNIIKNHGSGLYTDFIRLGYVYINNPDVVKKSGLSEIYKKILNKEQMEEVLSCTSEKGTELFSFTIKSQQMFIVDILVDRIASGEDLDLNYIDKLSRIVGADIMKYAEEAKSFLAMNLKSAIQ